LQFIRIVQGRAERHFTIVEWWFYFPGAKETGQVVCTSLLQFWGALFESRMGLLFKSVTSPMPKEGHNVDAMAEGAETTTSHPCIW
jgi:hypothetical protein